MYVLCWTVVNRQISVKYVHVEKLDSLPLKMTILSSFTHHYVPNLFGRDVSSMEIFYFFLKSHEDTTV